MPRCSSFALTDKQKTEYPPPRSGTTSSKSEKDLLLFCAHFWHFSFPPVLEDKEEKELKLNVHFPFSGFVGSERKNLSRTAGRKALVQCIFSGKKKGRAQRAGSPVPFALCTEKTEQGQSAAYLEQVSTTVPKSAILRFCPSRETCWGVPSPNPAMRLAPQKRFPSGEKFFSLSPRKCLTDKSIFCDK